jgi:hypothetical protein
MGSNYQGKIIYKILNENQIKNNFEMKNRMEKKEREVKS